ncbi:MAG TPA: HAD-IB family phosphatase [Planctomycetota bacterium]|nr:HAD-IB family phosphatase [Planctomycetota bacterium]
MKPPFDRVAFDADSTLSAIEGIDELAKMRRIDVSELTTRAMRGEVPLEKVYGLRLDLVRPDASMLARLGELYVERRVRGAAPTIAALRRAGIEVWIVSGALRPALLPLAASLDIPGHRVYAVDVSLDGEGRYAGFDARSPLARSDGKRVVLEELRDRARRTAMVGDGATDLAAAPAVDAFFAFTGVARREEVAARATREVHSFGDLKKILLPAKR